ncbi:MAG: type II toxin-antitoxin system HicB family antitoxin [Bradymonadaceae bacterium]
MSSDEPAEWAREEASRYTYQVQWDAEDEIYVGRVLEWDLLAAHGETEGEALEEIETVVAFALEESAEDGEDAPEPFGEREYSGRFNVRIPPSLHRELATQAASEGVSLNQLVTTKLAQ